MAEVMTETFVDAVHLTVENPRLKLMNFQLQLEKKHALQVIFCNFAPTICHSKKIVVTCYSY